jgi:REP element-mobilizing transposase RayT
MRKLRKLKPNVWYEIHTAINNREALFRLRQALALFRRVLGDTGERFVFEMTGLRLEVDRLTFYIRPEDGLELPDILKWMKQTFAVRYNRLMGRTGHIWGDRYWSVILDGEPPEEMEWDAGEEAAAEPKAPLVEGGRGSDLGMGKWQLQADSPSFPPITSPHHPRKRRKSPFSPLCLYFPSTIVLLEGRFTPKIPPAPPLAAANTNRRFDGVLNQSPE